MGFEPTTTEFRSDALTDWAIRPWVQLALRDNFVQLLQFHLFAQCSRFISVFAFVSHHICFKRSLAQVISLVAEWIDTKLNTQSFLNLKNFRQQSFSVSDLLINQLFSVWYPSRSQKLQTCIKKLHVCLTLYESLINQTLKKSAKKLNKPNLDHTCLTKTTRAIFW